MSCIQRISVPLTLIVVAFATTSCAPVVSNLKPGAGKPESPALPFSISVTVVPFAVAGPGGVRGEEVPARYRDAALTHILREHRVFALTETDADSGLPNDLVLRGEISARWDALAAGNFLTWWPGGLVFAPNWYGTRMQFFADARTELVDTRTGDVVGTYEASTAHELVHRSASPGQFFGAAIVIPNVVKGAKLTYPRDKYKRIMYPIAYEDLWQSIAGQIIEDLAGRYASEAKVRRERCGDRLGALPRIGQSWTDFVRCQSDYFEHFAEAEVEAGAASVFMNPESGFRIYVVDGKIVRWEKPQAMPGVGAPPPLVGR